MPTPRRFFTVLGLSLLAYVLVFGLLVDKPMTIGTMVDMIEYKKDYARSVVSPKLMIIGGSNVRCSHRCETIENETGVPCVNGGVAAGIGTQYLFAEYMEVLQPGDAVYLPLEFGTYTETRKQAMSGPESAYMVRRDRATLLRLGPERIVRSVFYFDLSFLVTGIAEMGLSRAGVKRRVGLDTLTPQGDESGHTAEKGAGYREIVDELPPPTLKRARFEQRTPGKQIVTEFLVWCRENEVQAVGGLPTTFDEVELTDGIVEEIRGVYETQGCPFIELPTRSQYPREHFYDTAYHLTEANQIAHTQRLVPALRRHLPTLFESEGRP